MKINLVSFDSFSTRSMATLIETDIKIFIDPSIAISPNRFGLPPSKIELEELEKGKRKIKELSRDVDLFIITHYHWDHCPNPNSELFNILYNKKVFAKDFNITNRSQYFRGRNVYNKLKNIEFADGREIEIENTYIRFSKPVFHGLDSKLGKVIMVYIEYKNDSILFGSDIQGFFDKNIKEFLLETNPKTFIFSGPPFYIYKDIKEKFVKDLEILNKLDVENVIIDHHSARDIYLLEFIKEIREIFRINFMTAADFMGYENKFLEANRKKYYYDR